MNLWDFIKIKASAQPRKQSKELSGSPQNGRIYFQMTLQFKDWYPRFTKNFSNTIHENQINQKMGRRYEQILFKQRHTNGLQTHEKMFKIIRHWVN